MSIPICSAASLYHNRTLFENISKNSLFSVFRSGRWSSHFTLKALEHLLEQGAHVNEVDEKFKMNFLQRLIIEEFSFVHREEGKEFRKIAEWLYLNGIDINHQRVDGCTALHLAALEEEWSMMKWLLEKGANRAIVDEDGKTALDYVNSCNGFWIDTHEVLELLLQ